LQLSRTGRASAARCTEYRLDVGGTHRPKLTESPTPDWEGLERSPEFHALVAAGRRFVVPAMIVFGVWFGGFLVLNMGTETATAHPA
jgi:hypothetical protein